LEPGIGTGPTQRSAAREGQERVKRKAERRAVLTVVCKAIGLRGYLFAKLGRTREAREVLNTLEAISREQYIPPYASALVHAGLGEREVVLEWLERAYDAHDVHLVLLVADPKWDAFRADARFLALVERCGFTGGAAGQKASPDNA
jgi:hypothetical protein